MASEQEVTTLVEGSQAQRAAGPGGPAAAPSLIDEYDLGDTNRDPDATPEPAPKVPGTSETTHEGPAPSSPKARDPETGRFLKADEAPKPVAAWLRREAIELGISEDEIDATDPRVLEQSVNHANRVLRKRFEQDQYARAVERPQKRVEFSGDERSAPPASPESKTATPLVEFPAEWEASLDQSFVKPLKAIFTGMAKQIAELKKTVGSIDQRHAQQEQASVFEQVDRAFAGMGNEFHAIVGAGSATEFAGADAAVWAERRRAVVDSLQRRPGKGSISQQVIQRAKELYGSFAAPPKAPAPSTPATAPATAPGKTFTAEEWAQMGLSQPNGRVGDEAEPPSEAKATRNLARRMKEMGIDPNGEGPRVPAKTNGDDGLLD